MSTVKTHIDDMQDWTPSERYLLGFGAVQLLVVILVAIGHTSTMPIGPGNPEILHHFGYDPSWLGVNVLFILAGFMAMRSLSRSQNGLSVTISRVKRIFPYLAAYALLIVLVVYPILGQPAASLTDLFKHLGLYAIDVLSCLDPGRVLPGLLDEANYMCVIQGAIWTFRWGIAAYVGIAIAAKLRLLDDRRKVLALAVIAVSGYVTLFSAQVWGLFTLPESLQPAARLGAMFAIGMAIFPYRAAIFKMRFLVPGLLVATLIQFYLLPWTPLIEVFTSVFWALAAFTLMRTPLAARLSFNKNQGLGIALYIFHWPIAQLILLSLPAISPLGLIAVSVPVALAFSVALSFIVSRGMPQSRPVTLPAQNENHA